jgi:hypothetical protein
MVRLQLKSRVLSLRERFATPVVQAGGKSGQKLIHIHQGSTITNITTPALSDDIHSFSTWAWDAARPHPIHHEIHGVFAGHYPQARPYPQEWCRLSPQGRSCADGEVRGVAIEVAGVEVRGGFSVG